MSTIGWHRNAALIAPLLLVNAAAIYGQSGWAFDHLGHSWPVAVLFALAVESIGVFLAAEAHAALMAGHASGALRIGSYAVGALVGTLNFAHYATQPGYRPNPLAVAFGLLSSISPWLWAIRSRSLNRERLADMGLIDPRAVKFSRLRWTLFPIRTFGAFRAAVWAGIQRPDEAVAAADARRHPAAGTPTALETTGLPAPASALAASAGSAVTTTADRTGTAGRPRRTGGTSRYAVAGARSDAALTAALAEVPRDADGTVPVRRAAAALRCGPDRARRLLAAAGLLRTTAPVPPTTIPTAVPDAAPEQMPAAA